MKKNILIPCLLMSIAVFGKPPVSSISFQFENVETSFRLELGGKTFLIEPGEDGTALFQTEMIEPGYVKLIRGARPELLFLFPNDKLEVIVKNKNVGQLGFVGKYARINEYLVDPKSLVAGGGFAMQEKEYTVFLENKVNELYNKLASMGFDERFVEKEKKRIAAKVYTSLVTYPAMRKRTERSYHPSEAYFSFVQSKLFEDAEMLDLEEYSGFIQYLYKMLATKDIKKYDAFTHTKASLDFVINEVRNKQVQADLINFYAYDFLKRNGVEQIEPITKIFKQYVTDPDKNRIYDTAADTWVKIAPGTLLPDFVFNDVAGNKVSLSTLRGKYVYIDVWATWCKPCIAEIPNLKKMEQTLEGRNIVFVSISTDKDHAAWKKMVTDDHFTGLQLHSPSREFSTDLMIVSIPRFILIDPLGKIVEANVSRPNRPETYQLMEKLAGL